MGKKKDNNPINHGLFIDSVNIGALIRIESQQVVTNEKVKLDAKIGEPKDAPKKMRYGGRRRIL